MFSLLDQLVDISSELPAGVIEFVDFIVHATHPVWRLVNAKHVRPCLVPDVANRHAGDCSNAGE
jgi:hypothetical protein